MLENQTATVPSDSRSITPIWPSSVCAAASASGPLAFERPREWDRRRFPPADDVLVLRTRETPPPGTRLRVVLGPEAPSPAGPLTPGAPAAREVELEPRFVVEGFRWSLLGGILLDANPPGLLTAVSAAISLVAILSGVVFFRSTERTFADVI